MTYRYFTCLYTGPGHELLPSKRAGASIDVVRWALCGWVGGGGGGGGGGCGWVGGWVGVGVGVGVVCGCGCGVCVCTKARATSSCIKAGRPLGVGHLLRLHSPC